MSSTTSNISIAAKSYLSVKYFSRTELQQENIMITAIYNKEYLIALLMAFHKKESLFLQKKILAALY